MKIDGWIRPSWPPSSCTSCPFCYSRLGTLETYVIKNVTCPRQNLLTAHRLIVFNLFLWRSRFPFRGKSGTDVAQLQWTSCPAPLAGEISCLEVLVDVLISYQIYTPLNKKNLKRKHGHTSHLDWEHISVVNYLPSPEEAALLPPPLLTECHATWLNTIDFLKPLVNLLPVERTTRRSLAHLGYSNMLPTWPSRPVLLAGNSASQFLAFIISPGARKLKHRCVIPRRPRKPLPPCFGVDFN